MASASTADCHVVVSDNISSPSSSNRLFSFGVVSDVQYADIPDGLSFHGVPRFYRNSLLGLRRCVEGWVRQGIDFGVHFGDILDGYQPKVGTRLSLLTRQLQSVRASAFM